MNQANHRVFVGLQLSGYLVGTIPMVKSTIVDKKQLINWVSGKNLHLTLSFIGEIESDNIELIKHKLEDIRKFNSFNINVSGTGCFPAFENPKVLWLDINKGGDELSNIQSEVEKISIPFKSYK